MDTNRREWFRIEEFDFLSLGKMLPAGEQAAQAVCDALSSMAWYAEAAMEEIGVEKKADGLTVAFRTDGMSVCEENAEQICAALTEALTLRMRPRDEDTFWVEISIPHVFPEASPDAAAFVSVDRNLQIESEIVLPDWLSDACNAVSQERAALRFEDFQVDHEQMLHFADVYTAVKALAARIEANFEFTEPKPPHNMNGGAHIKHHGVVVFEEETLAALIDIIKISKSFSVSSTSDGHIYLSFWVNHVYSPKA